MKASRSSSRSVSRSESSAVSRSSTLTIELSSSRAATSRGRSTGRSEGSVVLAVREYLSDDRLGAGAGDEAQVPPRREEGVFRWHRSVRFLLTSAVFVSDFLLRAGCVVIYARHYMLNAVFAQALFQALAATISMTVACRDADVRRWLRAGVWPLRAAKSVVAFIVFGCCQVIHLKRAWARQLCNAEVLRNLESRDFLWTGPVLGAERTLPVALLTGVPFALLSAYNYVKLDCTFEGLQSRTLQRYCEQHRDAETAVLACATVLAVSVVGLGVVDVDLAVSGHVASRYHLDPGRTGSRAGRCQCLYPAVHVCFRLVEVLLRVALLAEAAILSELLWGWWGVYAAIASLAADFAVGVCLLRRHAPRAEPLHVHLLAGIGLLLADVAHFVDRPGFCLPSCRISCALGWWRLSQFVVLSGGAVLALELSSRAGDLFTSRRWLRGLLVLAASSAAYCLLRFSPMIHRAGDDLHTAVLRRRITRLRKLLDAGSGGEVIDVNGRTKDAVQATPAMLATEAGDLDALFLLVEAGALVHPSDGLGESCLHRAVRGLRLEALDFLTSQPGAGKSLREHEQELRGLAEAQSHRLSEAQRERLASLLSPRRRSQERASGVRSSLRSVRCVRTQLAAGRNLCKLFPDELTDGIPPPHELHSVSALVFAHAAGALSQALLPSPTSTCWLESLQRVRALGRGAVGEVIEVEETQERSPQVLVSAESSREWLSSVSGWMSVVSPRRASGGRRFAMKLQTKMQAQACWQACAEVVALRRAVHPFIVRLEHAFQTPQHYVLLLELCPRGDLNHLLCTACDEDGRLAGLPVPSVARYGGQVLLALLHLHEVLGIIYRDLKPQNILVSRQDEAKLADFGTARYVGDTGKASLSLVGTRGFLAPELVLAGDDSEEEEDCEGAGLCGVYTDPFKTDAYSYGVTLEVLLLGEDCADVIEDDWSMCMLPRMQSDADRLRILAGAADVGRIPAEGTALLAELLPSSPARRRSLADPVVRQHPFFLRALNCQDLAAELLPVQV